MYMLAMKRFLKSRFIYPLGQLGPLTKCTTLAREESERRAYGTGSRLHSGFLCLEPKKQGDEGHPLSRHGAIPLDLTHGAEAHGNGVGILVKSLETESGLPNRRQDLAKCPEERMALMGIAKVLDTRFISEGSHLPRRAGDVIDHSFCEGINPLGGKVGIHELQIAVKDPFKRVKIHQHKASTRLEDSSYSLCPEGEVGEPMHHAVGAKNDVKLPVIFTCLLQPVEDVSALKCGRDAGVEGQLLSETNRLIADIHPGNDSPQVCRDTQCVLPGVANQMHQSAAMNTAMQLSLLGVKKDSAL